MTAGDSHSRPGSIAIGTNNNLERLIKNFRQHVNQNEDAKDTKEYNTLYKSFDERELEWPWQNELGRGPLQPLGPSLC